MLDLASGTKRSFELPKGIGKCEKLQVERSDQLLIATFSDKSVCVFNIPNTKFVGRLTDLDFSRSYMDENCCYVATADPRGRAIDFHWIRYENIIKRVPKPILDEESHIDVVVEDPKAKKAKSSLCNIF